MSQESRLYELLKDYQKHSTAEIQIKVYGRNHLGVARISGRIFNIKKKHKVNINCFKDEKNPSLSWYQMEIPSENQEEKVVQKKEPESEPPKELFKIENSYKNIL